MKNLTPFQKKEEHMLRQDLATAYHLAAYFGWDDLIYGHLSVRLPSQPEYYLINQFGLMFDEITPDNLLKVDLDGKIVGNQDAHINPAGENIHNAIYSKRQDVFSVIHCHSLHGVATSILQEGILPLSQHSCHVHNRIAFHEYEGIAVRKEEQQSLVDDLGDKDIMILRNHGFLTVGHDLPQAFCTMHMLEKTAQTQMMALSCGRPVQILSQEMCDYVLQQANTFGSNKIYKMEWDALVRMLSRRQYKGADILRSA